MSNDFHGLGGDWFRILMDFNRFIKDSDGLGGDRFRILMDFDRFVRDFWMGGGGDFIAEFLVLHLHSSSFFIILHHSSLISV